MKGIGLLVAAVLLAGCGGTAAATPHTSSSPTRSATPTPTPSPSTLSILGALNLTASDFYLIKDGDPCSGSGGYADIDFGTQVVVTSETGEILATSQLQSGTIVSLGVCGFNFSIVEVPPGHPFYGIQVSHRGVLQYSAAQLSDPVVMTLGH